MSRKILALNAFFAGINITLAIITQYNYMNIVNVVIGVIALIIVIANLYLYEGRK